MASPIPTGLRQHQIMLQTPGSAAPDGLGGYVRTNAVLATVMAQVVPASARDLERVAANTVIATASHIVTFPYVAGVTTQTEILFKGRTLYVRGVQNVNEADVELIAICEEVVT